MYKILFAALLLVLLQSCSSPAPKKMQSPDEIPVTLVPVQSDSSLLTVRATGLLGTGDEASLSFKIGGVIDQVLVREGDPVRKGQLLATLRPAEIGAQVQQAQLALEKAERDYQRTANLFRDSVATLEQLQNARTGAEIARQQVQQASFNQQYSRIYAPADGYIVRQLGHPGEVAGPGTPVLFMGTVGGRSKWVLKVGLPDQDWALVETGNRAEVTIDAYPGQRFPAVLTQKSLAADPASGSFPVELEVNMGTEKPARGLFGTAHITPSQRPQSGSRIPYEALLEANGEKGFVFVTNDRKTVKKVEVTVAGIDNQVVSLSSGLEGYKYVISAGSPYLTDGSRIRVQR